MNSFTRESNIEEERSNKKEEADASVPCGISSRDAPAVLPPLSPSAKVAEALETCRSIREEVLRSRPEITLDTISYMRLSLLTAKTADHDGDGFTRLAINMDVSFNNNHQFKKFKWRLTNRRREFYPNLPPDWKTDLAYGSAWEFYNELEYTKWIGKACYRLNRRESVGKLQLAPLTAIVAWVANDTMNYRLWIENAEVSGQFNIDSESKYYIASSEPIHNFTAKTSRIISI